MSREEGGGSPLVKWGKKELKDFRNDVSKPKRRSPADWEEEKITDLAVRGERNMANSTRKTALSVEKESFARLFPSWRGERGGGDDPGMRRHFWENGGRVAPSSRWEGGGKDQWESIQTCSEDLNRGRKENVAGTCCEGRGERESFVPQSEREKEARETMRLFLTQGG